MNATEMTEPLMTVGQVAKMLSMSTAWVRQHSGGQRQPTIPSLKMGSKAVRYSRPAVEAWVKTLERKQ
jgi:predicted DNA-binding transcriptional regulator AlpA